MPSYLAPSSLIEQGYYTNAEYKKYRENRQKIQAMNLRERTKELASEQKFRETQRTREIPEERVYPQQVRILPWSKAKKYYVPTPIMRVARNTAGFLSQKAPLAYRAATTRGGITQALYRGQGQLPPTNVEGRFKTVQGMKSGRRGRPKGTLDQRYAAYGGVYGYRKYMATQLKIQRMEAMRRNAVTPQQQAVLAQIEARRQYNQSNPEGQIIPNTNGNVDMDYLMREINNAANAVG